MIEQLNLELYENAFLRRDDPTRIPPFRYARINTDGGSTVLIAALAAHANFDDFIKEVKLTGFSYTDYGTLEPAGEIFYVFSRLPDRWGQRRRNNREVDETQNVISSMHQATLVHRAEHVKAMLNEHGSDDESTETVAKILGLFDRGIFQNFF